MRHCHVVSQSTHECRASLLTSADCLLALQHPPLSALTRTIIQRSRLSYVFEPLHFRLSRVVCSYSWPCASSFAGSVLLHTGDLISGTPKSRCCKRSPFPPTARTGCSTHSERNGHLPVISPKALLAVVLPESLRTLLHLGLPLRQSRLHRSR